MRIKRRRKFVKKEINLIGALRDRHKFSDTPLVTQFWSTQKCVTKGVSTVYERKNLHVYNSHFLNEPKKIGLLSYNPTAEDWLDELLISFARLLQLMKSVPTKINPQQVCLYIYIYICSFQFWFIRPIAKDRVVVVEGLSNFNCYSTQHYRIIIKWVSKKLSDSC